MNLLASREKRINENRRAGQSKEEKGRESKTESRESREGESKLQKGDESKQEAMQTGQDSREAFTFCFFVSINFPGCVGLYIFFCYRKCKNERARAAEGEEPKISKFKSRKICLFHFREIKFPRKWVTYVKSWPNGPINWSEKARMYKIRTQGQDSTPPMEDKWSNHFYKRKKLT